jgi:RNA polymerase-interacting CarD/CdnL/TRCF family regulator
VARDLTWQKYSAHLTKVDRDLLNWGRDLLANEIALVTNTEVAKARKRVELALKEASVNL